MAGDEDPPRYIRYATAKEAQADINEYVADTLQAVIDGYMEDCPKLSDFRITDMGDNEDADQAKKTFYSAIGFTG